MDVFGQSLDLPAIASAAGLGGGAVGAVLAGLFFRGLIVRFLAQVAMTTVLTGIGFWALLNFLGYEIVPNPEVEQKLDLSGMVSPQSLDQPESLEFAAAPSPEEQELTERVKEAKAEGKKIIYMRTPGK